MSTSELQPAREGMVSLAVQKNKDENSEFFRCICSDGKLEHGAGTLYKVSGLVHYLKFSSPL